LIKGFTNDYFSIIFIETRLSTMISSYNKSNGTHASNYNLVAGIHIEQNVRVRREDLASHLKTGKVPFISTAAMIVYMEQCCVALIDPNLPVGYDSVSSEMNVRHLNTAIENEEIICRSHLKFIEGNKLFFDVAMVNKNGESIGIGAHERYIICHNSFVEKHL